MELCGVFSNLRWRIILFKFISSFFFSYMNNDTLHIHLLYLCHISKYILNNFQFLFFQVLYMKNHLKQTTSIGRK